MPRGGTIVSIAPTNPSNPTFGLGDEILLWVGLNVPVTVTGMPCLKLLFGEGSGYAGADNYDHELPPGQTTRYACYDPIRSSP